MCVCLSVCVRGVRGRYHPSQKLKFGEYSGSELMSIMVHSGFQEAPFFVFAGRNARTDSPFDVGSANVTLSSADTAPISAAACGTTAAMGEMASLLVPKCFLLFLGQLLLLITIAQIFVDLFW